MTLDKNEIESLGESLRVIKQKILKPCHEKDAVRIWLQGGEPYFDIFLDLKNDEIIWFQFTLRGKFLSWYHKNNLLQTGKTHELNIDDVSFHPASKVIDNDNICDLEFINLATSILQTRTDEEILTKALKLISSAKY